MISRREFIAATGAAVTVSSVTGATIPDPVAPGNAAAAAPEKSSRLFLPEDDLKPATYDRLSLDRDTQPQRCYIKVHCPGKRRMYEHLYWSFVNALGDLISGD